VVVSAAGGLDTNIVPAKNEKAPSIDYITVYLTFVVYLCVFLCVLLVVNSESYISADV